MRTHVIGLAVSALLLGPLASAQWVPTNGPYGGDVRCFAVIPASGGAGTPTVYVGTYCGGVFRSTDDGTSWTAANTGLTHPAVNALAVNSADGAAGLPTLFAGTCGGVFRSTDGGASWAEANSGIMNPDTRSLAVSPDPYGTGVNHVLAGTAGGGVYLSTDNGTSWVSAGVTNACLTSMVASGKTLLAGEPAPSGGGG